MKYDNEVIILIEYFNDIPFSVITEYTIYDFEMHANGWLMFFESGGGKNFQEKNGKKLIKLEFNYCIPTAGKIWIDSQYAIVPEVQKGVTILKTPIMIPNYCDEKLKYNNPFVIGEEVAEIYYCEECQANYTEDGCHIHEKVIE